MALVTIQKTAKRYKAQQVACLALFFGGLIYVPIASGMDERLGMAAFGLSMFSGLWYFVVKILIWWNHG